MSFLQDNLIQLKGINYLLESFQEQCQDNQDGITSLPFQPNNEGQAIPLLNTNFFDSTSIPQTIPSLNYYNYFHQINDTPEYRNFLSRNQPATTAIVATTETAAITAATAIAETTSTTGTAFGTHTSYQRSSYTFTNDLVISPAFRNTQKSTTSQKNYSNDQTSQFGIDFNNQENDHLDSFFNLPFYHAQEESRIKISSEDNQVVDQTIYNTPDVNSNISFACSLPPQIYSGSQLIFPADDSNQKNYMCNPINQIPVNNDQLHQTMGNFETKNNDYLPRHQDSLPQSHRKKSESSETCIIEGAKKRQSRFKNANKFCMVSLLNYLIDQLISRQESHHLIKYIVRVKESGKILQKVDIFTLVHFRLLFLKLNESSLSQLRENDLQMHKIIFSEFSEARYWTQLDIDEINLIKSQFFSISIEFFEDPSNIKKKILTKVWQNENTASYYIQWAHRILKGLNKMATGLYLYHF